MQFYQRLKDARNDADKSQQEIADILHTYQQQYARWESGRYQMPIEHYKTLARYYNISIDYLSGLSDTPKTLDGKPYIVTKSIGGNTTTITGNGNKINIKN